MIMTMIITNSLENFEQFQKLKARILWSEGLNGNDHKHMFSFYNLPDKIIRNNHPPTPFFCK